jgi:hypothetical protein
MTPKSKSERERDIKREREREREICVCHIGLSFIQERERDREISQLLILTNSNIPRVTASRTDRQKYPCDGFYLIINVYNTLPTSTASPTASEFLWKSVETTIFS